MEGEGLFVSIGMGTQAQGEESCRARRQAQGIGIGAAEGAQEGILRGFEWFLLCL